MFPSRKKEKFIFSLFVDLMAEGFGGTFQLLLLFFYRQGGHQHMKWGVGGHRVQSWGRGRELVG